VSEWFSCAFLGVLSGNRGQSRCHASDRLFSNVYAKSHARVCPILGLACAAVGRLDLNSSHPATGIFATMICRGFSGIGVVAVEQQGT
jgi:hypothetical protein